MRYVIYAAVAALVLWSVWYLIRHLRRQIRGGGCCGDCDRCGTSGTCTEKDKKGP
ncbi:MAG: FeoB-associated Cys-rich membrane protein [Clostridiales bacterium]|nr:FeoB-associated Cys-rich membrane protein [Clostridiales bacterium]